MKIEISKNKKKGKWFFRVVAGNGKVMLKSGLYSRVGNVNDTVATLKAGMPEAKVVLKP